MEVVVNNSVIATAIVQRAARIKVILMDVDGVLTDGKIFFVAGADNQMVETKSFNAQDGLGLHFCAQLGFKTGVISGRDSKAVVERAGQLKMTYVYQGNLAKEGAFKEILADAGVLEDEVAFIGDDFTDAPLITRVGLGVAVANARPELKAVAHMVTIASGGDGAVREVIEVILKAQGKWDELLSRFKLA